MKVALEPPSEPPHHLPGEAHDHGGDDGDLHGADDGGDEDVVQLLATRDHVQDVEVQQLVALGAAVGRLTPAGGGGLESEGGSLSPREGGQQGAAD